MLKVALLALAAAIALAAGFGTRAGDALEKIELLSIDSRFSVGGGPDVDEDRLLIVDFDVDKRSRLVDARAIRRLHSYEPDVLVVDFEYAERGDPDEDSALLDAVYEAKGTLLATALIGEGGDHPIFGGEETVRSVRAQVGDSTFPVDSDGAIRRMEYKPRGIRTLAVLAAERAAGHQIAMEKDGEWIAFQGEPGTIPTVSLSDTLGGDVPASRFEDKLVFLGYADPEGGRDVSETPVSDFTPGAEIQATAAGTALGGFPLKSAGSGLDALLIALLGLAAPAAGLRLSAWRVVGLGAGLLALYLLSAQLAFGSGTILSVVYPSLALVLGAAATFGVNFTLERRERKRTRELFSRFVPGAVVDRALAGENQDERVEATVMFADLRGFTRFAESRPAERISEVLNRYLGEMTNAIEREGGTVVSFMGDGVMAVFGAPTPYPDHAERALRAARRMAGDALDGFNEWLGEERFRMGVGISSGEVMSGLVGPEGRLEYATVGDTTNVGARLEALTKETGHTILMSDATKAKLPPEQAAGLVRVGELTLPGRDAPCEAWALRVSAVSPGGRD